MDLPNIKLHFLLIVCVCMISCTKNIKEYYPNGTLKSEVEKKMGKKNGVALYYFPSGALEVKMIFKNDKLNGLYEKFNALSTKIESVNYKNGLRNGLSAKFYNNGKVLSIAHYENDTLHGACEEYYQNGIVRISGQYYYGLYDGRWEYTDMSGLNAGYGEFEKGKGKQIAIYPRTGRIRVETDYDKNLKNGREIYYTENGDIEKIIVFDYGKIIDIKQIISL